MPEVPVNEMTEQQLLLTIYRTQLTHQGEIMASLAEITTQIRDGIVKERADHQRLIDQITATLTDQAQSAEAARDQALAELAAAQADNAAAGAGLLSVVDDLSSNDLPDEPVEGDPANPDA